MAAFTGIARADGKTLDHALLREFSSTLSVEEINGSHLSRCSIAIFLSQPDGRRMQLLPLNTECWPPLAVVGTIDNLQELGADVAELDGDKAVATLLKKYGVLGGLQRLRGKFSLAHWDCVRKELILARDPIGVRPLFYHFGNNVLTFSTDLSALLPLPWIPKNLDETRLLDLLIESECADAAATCYKYIKQVPRGGYLNLSAEGCVPVNYWSPPSRIDAIESRADFAHALRTLVVDAVERELPADGQVAVSLSGGLDSSAIACIAARALRRSGRRLLAVCAVHPGHRRGGESDEKQYMEAVLEQEPNIDPVWVELATDVSPFSAAVPWFELLGQPSYSVVTHAERAIAEAGRRHGVSVVLSGFGGDFFASYRGPEKRHALSRLAQQRWTMARIVRRVRRLKAARTPLAILAQELHFQLQARSDVVAGAARARLRAASCQDAMRIMLEPGHLDFPISSIVNAFEHGFSQSIRFPLLDQRIIEFILQLPVAQFTLGGRSRGLFRSAMLGILPEGIRQREDKGPAFDPAIASRVSRALHSIERWAEDGEKPGWRFVNRHEVLATARRIVPADRAAWQSDMFTNVLQAGTIAMFVDWHAERELQRWSRS